MSCEVFTSNTFDISISISTRKMNGSVFLVLILMLMSNALLVKTAQDIYISGFVLLVFALMLMFMSRQLSFVLMLVLVFMR